MARKKVCKVCGSRAVEFVCKMCGRNICGGHVIGLDVPMTLEQRSRLGLGEYRDHPTFPLCLDDEGKGCAKKVMGGILKVLKK